MKNSRIRRIIAFLLCLALLMCSSGSSAFIGSLQAAEIEKSEETFADQDLSVVNVEVTSEEEIEEEQAAPVDESEIEEQISDPAVQESDAEETDSVEEREDSLAEDTDTNLDSTEQDPAESPKEAKPGIEESPEEVGPNIEEHPEHTEEELTEDLENGAQDLEENPQTEKLEAFEEKYEDEQVVIYVEAEPGVIPDGARLSVKQVVQQDIEAMKAAGTPALEEIAEAEELNAKYENVQRELEASMAEEEEKEIAGFLAYDISFLMTDETGETKEVEPEGDVSVSMEFAKAYLPEELVDHGEAQINHVDVIHMKEVEDEETGGTILKAEVLDDAEISMTENSEVEKAEFVVDRFSTFTITWTTVNGSGKTTFTIQMFCVDENGEEIIGQQSDMTLDVPAGEEIDLAELAPEIDGYVLCNIRRYTATSTLGGWQIRYLKGGSDGSIQIIQGTWTKGSWENGEWKEASWEPKSGSSYGKWDPGEENRKIYFVYEPAEFIFPIHCVDQNGKPLPGISVSDLKMPIRKPDTIDLLEMVPEVPGYTFQRIRRNTMNGYQVRYLRTDEKGLYREEGSWDSGKWVSEGTEIQWTTKPEGLYFVYEPETISVVYIDGKTNAEISGVTAAPLTLNGVSGKTLDLLTYVPHIEGYSFRSISIDRASTIQLNQLKNSGGENEEYGISYSSGEWELEWTPSNGSNPVFQFDGWKPWTGEQKILYMTYEPLPPSEGSGGDTGDDASVPPPAHRKYIKYNEEENDYTLTLNVTGSQEAAKPIDILLIVDLSNSMEVEDGVQTDRYVNLNNALDVLKKSLQEAATKDSNLDINIGVVSFNSNGMIDADKLEGGKRTDWTYVETDSNEDAEDRGWWELDDFSWKVTPEMCKGATNWQAGIRMGNSVLSDHEREDSRKCVIFLTDGNPTCRYFTGSSTITQGNGGNDPYGNNYNAAVNEWSQSSALCSSTARFVIDANENPENDCEKFAEAIDAEELSGIDNESMLKSFEQIAGEIIYPGYTDVSITDTLSIYTEFVEEDPKITVTYRESGSENEELLDEELYDAQVDVPNKKVTVKLLNGGKLVDGTIYSISFRVRPTQEAREEYIETGYPHTGDLDTDAEGNTTSSGKPGFHSNADDGAVVYYRYNYGDEKEDGYRHPVVQVEQPDAEHAEITKTMGAAVGSEEGTALRYPITLQVKTRQEMVNQILVGSAGDGWKVVDKMADYTTFLALEGAVMNGHELILSEEGRKLVFYPEEEAQPVTIAEYTEEGTGNGTLTWYLHSELAVVEESLTVQEYCYTLTYYVNFEDSGKTELRNTNTTTYVVILDQPENLYPDKMPYFVNVVGSKKDAAGAEGLAGAEFNVYRDSDGTSLIAEGITSGQDGRFSFQIGESDLTGQTMTVYLKEVKAPDGYAQDGVIHPVEIQVSEVHYKRPENTIENSQIWDSKTDADWGSVSEGKVSLDHKEHDNLDDDLLSISSSGDLELLYRNHGKDSWSIVKTSASDPTKRLSGAEFGLYEIQDGTAKLAYTGISDAQGRIDAWTLAESEETVESAYLLTGAYEMREIKAPEGYVLSKEVWSIIIASDGTVSITSNDAKKVPINENGTYYFYFENALLYELPSTGSIGIYWYTISGTLLMMAGMLILYKRKYAGRC